MPIPVYVAGSTGIIHAGRVVGRYASGHVRYAKVCTRAGRDRHDPMAVTPSTAITCKRCLAKIES